MLIFNILDLFHNFGVAKFDENVEMDNPYF